MITYIIKSPKDSIPLGYVTDDRNPQSFYGALLFTDDHKIKKRSGKMRIHTGIVIDYRGLENLVQQV